MSTDIETALNEFYLFNDHLPSGICPELEQAEQERDEVQTRIEELEDELYAVKSALEEVRASLENSSMAITDALNAK